MSERVDAMTGGAAGASPPARAGDREVVVPTPIGRRAVARLLDFTVGAAMFVIMVWLIGVAAGPSPDGTGVMLVAIVVTSLVYLLYEVILVALWGRTLGKQIMGLEVVRVDGGRPGLARAFLRNLVPTLLLVGFFPLYPLPYVLAAIAKDHRGPHDRLAGTEVVVRSR